MTWEFPCWDPVLLDLPGPLDVRWYGLMYVVAFVCAQWILTRLARGGFLAIEPEKVGDLIFYGVVGTILGGRAGYALFYDQSLLNPLEFIKVWQGGLAFHGGLLGVVVAFWLFARKHRLPVLRVGDACAIAVTPGILAVRIANFVNGELYGRITTAETLGAMRFPTDPAALEALGLLGHDVGKRGIELGVRYACGKIEWEAAAPALGANADALRERLDWAAVREQVPFRHPSQLYEGLSEGLLLGLVLFAVYRATRARPLQPGAYGGIFLLGYGTVRFALEFLRQPDRQFTGPDDPVGTVLFGMTMGQTLCAAMVVAGIALLVPRGRRRAAVEAEVVREC